jgi:NDP-sugar pyrophosphorylase family protein
VKAMLFAAGLGTRLRPLTDRVPKPLVPVAGRPMIDYPLLLLRHYGIRDIVVNVHHLRALLAQHLGDGAKFGLNITYSEETELLDTGGGLLKARPFLDGATFIVINSDVLIDVDLKDVIERHRARGAAASLVLRKDPEADRYGSIEISSDGRVQRFLKYEAPSIASAGALEKFMFTGVQILEPGIFEVMAAEPSRRFGTTTSTYPKMLMQGMPLDGYVFEGFWQDLGTPERIAQAEAKLASGEVKLRYL